MLSNLSVFKTNAFVLLLAFAFTLSTISLKASAQDTVSGSYAYIALDPDIVTNYTSDNAKKLGYLRLTIEIMLDNPSFIMHIEQHMPLLRATAIEVVGAQSEQNVRSLTGREDMRRKILKRFRAILLKETGDEVIKDIIFTKYLRQG